MTVLLVDLGNTRIKWARLGARGVGRQRAAAHADWSSADFSRALFGAGSRGRARVTQVIAVCVAAPATRRAFAAAVRAATGRPPSFCRSAAEAAGVRNGYRAVWRLGADRWVALVGARAVVGPRAVIVADVGTATTLDLLDASGRHRGGAILPGPQLMIDALLRDTGGIRRRAAAGAMRGRRLFARDTAAALAAGALHGTAGAIERALREARAELDARSVLLLLTGGAAASVAPLLRTPARLVPDLVLQGLAALASAQARV